MSSCGTVTQWSEDRGFGFISPHGGGQKIFVHRSQVQVGTVLRLNDQVRYDAQPDAVKGKPRAVNVSGAAGACRTQAAAETRSSRRAKQAPKKKTAQEAAFAADRANDELGELAMRRAKQHFLSVGMADPDAECESRRPETYKRIVTTSSSSSASSASSSSY